MRFKELAKLIASLPPEVTILLIGPPGIGKSSLARVVSELDAKRANCEPFAKVCDLACYLPEDLLGVPFKEYMKINGAEQSVTKHAAPSWISELSIKDRVGMLVLDDLPAAAKSVQVAAFRITEERAAGDKKFSDNVRIICTGNRREDKSGASTLPAALRNRMVILQIDPDLEEWAEWYAGMGYPGEIVSFLHFRPAHLSKLPKEADDNGAFATPRSWEKLAKCLDGAKANDMVYDVAKGLVGEGVAVEFSAFIRTVDDLPNPKDVLRDPEGVMPKPPTEPDQLIAIVSSIAEFAAKMKRDDKTKLFMLALAHICQDSFEYAGTAVSTFINRGGELRDIINCIKENKNNPNLSKLMRHLRSALK